MKICPKCEMTFSDFAEKCEFCNVDLEDYHPESTVSEIEKIYEASQTNKIKSAKTYSNLSTKETLGYIVAGALCIISLVFLFLSGKSCIGCIGGDKSASEGVGVGIFGTIFFLVAAFFVWAINCTGEITPLSQPKNTSNPKTTPTHNKDEVRCPKCGSTQITAVQRKWTFMAGFATNKVDRFCMNCKHKW